MNAPSASPSLCSFAFLALLFLASGCDQIGPDEAIGRLLVTVVDETGERVPDARITADPPLGVVRTDGAGRATFFTLPEASYRVAATSGNKGSGVTTVVLERGIVEQITLTLSTATFFSFAPIVNIQVPEDRSGYSDGEEITFTGIVSDEGTAPSELAVQWTSDRDGMLGTSTPDEDGRVNLITSGLSPATHLIRLIASDTDSHTTVDSIFVSTLLPRAVTLSPPTKQNGQVLLQWSRNDEATFTGYLVYRRDTAQGSGNNVTLRYITDPDVTTLIDAAPPSVNEVAYGVVVFNTYGERRESNEQRVQNPAG
ncbi:MAG: carboxypeptidase-like regulatory domain-containing protein [Bacteroidota bacterium]